MPRVASQSKSIVLVLSTHPTISFPHRVCNGSIAPPDGFDEQCTTQAVAQATTVTTSAGVPCHSNHDRTVDMFLTVSLHKVHAHCSVPRATLPSSQSDFRSRQFGAGGRCTTSGQVQKFRAAPRTAGTALSLLSSYSCLSTLPMSQYAIIWSPKHYQRMVPCIHPLLSGVVSRPSPMQVPANASSAEGQCGKLTTLPLRASANTNTMTTAPNEPFSSSRVLREAHTGQAFAPACTPPLLQVSTDEKAFAIPNLTAILVRLVALSARAR